MTQDDLLLALIEEAKKDLGIKERGGPNKGKRVEEFQKTVSDASRNGSGTAVAESWCMAAVQTWVKQVEDATGVKSPIYASEHCLTVWNRTPSEARSKTPFPGAIAIWQKPGTTLGHTGIVEKVLEGSVITIEGNTGSGGQREGDGVYRRVRYRGPNKTLTILGYLNPFYNVTTENLV